MKTIHRKRLLKLAAFLAGPVARAAKRNKARKFNLDHYANSVNLGLRKNECGTSACALGWATQVFPRTFRLGKELKDLNGDKYCGLRMNGKYLHDPEDARDFFGLSYNEAYKAFSAEFSQRTIPQEVAILRKLAAGK